METSGEFIAIAIVEGNYIELQKEAMEKVFGSSELQECQIAIFSVFGKPSNQICRFLGKMLRYLLKKNGVHMDGSLKQQILEFGTNIEKNKPCIVTWTKPIFISKGVKNAAVFLLDIRGTFSDCNDPNYIMLSGLCSYMSSSCLYLCDGNQDGYLKHIESIALEGIRHRGKKKSFVHQKMTVVMENWSATDHFTYGDKDGVSYAKHMEGKLKAPQNKVFKAFEEFTFFFLPSDDNSMYSHFYNKLFRVTLDSCYIATKKIGTFLNPRQILDDVKRYVDEMDDEVFNGSLSDFLQTSPTDGQLERKQIEVIQKTKSKSDAYANPKKLFSTKPRKSTSSVEKQNSLVHENYLLKKNTNKEAKESLKYCESSDSSEDSEDISTAIQEKDLKTNNEKRIFAELKSLKTSILNRDSKLRYFRRNEQLSKTKNSDDEEINITPDAKSTKTSYVGKNEIFDLTKYLQDMSPNQPKNVEVNKLPPENPLRLPSPKEILNNTSQALKPVPAIRRTNVSTLKESSLLVSDLGSFSKPKTSENSRQVISNSNSASTPVSMSNKQNESSSNVNTTEAKGANNVANENLPIETRIEVKITHIFPQTGLQSGTSNDDIVKELDFNLQTNKTDLNESLEKYKRDINEAILSSLL